ARTGGGRAGRRAPPPCGRWTGGAVLTAPLPVPAAPPLSHVAQVELMHIGTWDASTGRHTFTADDLAFAVAAMDCPAVHRPRIKLGHTDPRFDGEPAVGWVDNLAVVDGRALVGDLVGMPGWLATPDANGHTVIASAYPQRSIEGEWDYRCALGHVHPFVLTGLALLGISEPAIGTLASLQDVAALYGVAASAPHTGGTPVTVQMRGQLMPSPSPRQVAAGVTTEDVRRKFYDSAPWSQWIEEFHLDPLQLIVLDDDTGTRQRVPVVVDPAGDGTDGVTFGAAVPVVVRYDDAAPADAAPAAPAAATDPAATVAASTVLRYASRAESRPGRPAAAATPAAPASGDTTTTQGGSGVEITNEQLAALRTALGLADDADLDAIIAAIQELVTTAAEDATTAAAEQAAAAEQVAAGRLPAGAVAIDSGRLAALEADSQRFAAFLARQRADDIEVTLSTAVREGRITPANREAWRKTLDTDLEHGKALLSSMAANTAVPVSELGHATEVAEVADVRSDAVYKNWSI
ncbi:phage protease, partial [Nocardia sp. CC216A]|uniref:phage protease n=2 Tax=unclassified Nocardia TaxID=2637762 RepID=UPI00279623EF